MSLVLQKVVPLLCVPLLTAVPNPIPPDHSPRTGILHHHGEATTHEEGRVGWAEEGGSYGFQMDEVGWAAAVGLT